MCTKVLSDLKNAEAEYQELEHACKVHFNLVLGNITRGGYILLL